MKKITVTSIILEYIKENPKLFALYCLTVASLPITEVILPNFYGKIISNLQSKSSIKQYIIPVIVLLVTAQCLILLNDVLESVLYPRMHGFIRKYCLDYIIAGSTTDIQELQIGEILAKMIRFAPMLYNYIDCWKSEIIPYIVIYIVIIIFLSFHDKYLSLIILIMAMAIIYLTFKSMTSCVMISKQRDNMYNQIYEQVDEILRNMVSVLNNNNYDYEHSRIQILDKKYKEYAMGGLLCSFRYKAIFFVIFVILLVIFLYRMIHLYKSNKLSNATLISIFIIMLFLFNTLIKHTNQFKDLMYRYGTITEALTFFNNTADKDKLTMNKPLIEAPKLLTNYCLVMKDIVYKYKDKEPILNGFNLNIECKKNIAFIGNIGCGKSTILKLIMKYILPTKGEIYINGDSYDTLNEQEIRKKIGYIQQSCMLFNRSLMENIKYGSINSTNKDVNDMILKLNLNKHFSRYPEGLETMAGKSGSNLSGGEKQIIWILRILLQNPEIILLDEPTSAMDDNTKDSLLELLINVLKEKTVICITHDNDILKYFDNVYEIKHGVANHIKVN